MKTNFEISVEACRGSRHRENGKAGKRGIRNAVVARALKLLSCGAAFFCCVAYASEQQVIVDGAQRLGGVVRTSGHNVPLLHALEQILPTSYSVNVPNAGAWADAPVSWHSGEPVARVLGDVLSVDASLQARVDTDLRLVTVTARPRRALADGGVAAAGAAAKTVAAATPVAPAVTTATPSAPPLLATASAQAPAQPAQSPAPHAATQLLPTAAPAPQPAPPAPTAPPTPPAQTEWQMRKSDGSVRNALARWASEAGWQFVWDVPTDYQVDATATIHGTLEDALRQVTDALAGFQVPIQVVLYQRNHVMRVIAKGAS